MNYDNWQKIKQIFNSAVELSPELRGNFVAGSCGGNKELRRDVEELLNLYDTEFLESPAAATENESESLLSAGALIGRYQIVRKLGEGGMGAVYLAKDGKLDRKVAIKVLNKKYERSEENIRRFVREAKAASALNHPNILTIHEIDDTETSKFIVSEFVKGETLRDVLRKGAIELNSIIDIGIQIAGALAAAHKARIIHRDIKPENIIVREDGNVKVLDFGLAKLMQDESSAFSAAAASGITETARGVIIGTASYMSPEQAKGEKIDGRTDIFSLGIVIYEMITGKAPFTGASIAETFANLISKDPEPLESCTSGAPEALQVIVSKMLQKDREERYQTVEDLLTDLKEFKERQPLEIRLQRNSSLHDVNETAILSPTTGDAPFSTQRTDTLAPWYRQAVFLVLFPILVVSMLGLIWYWSSPAADSRIKSLAVLPLKSLDSGENYLGFGIADAVIRKISQTGSVTVRPTSSVRRYLAEEIDAMTAAKELHVDVVLEGTVQRSGERTRVSVNLLRAEDGVSLWAESFDTQEIDLFAIQDTVSQQVAARLQLHLDPVQQARLAKRMTSNPIAYEFYVKGVYSYDERGFGPAAKAQHDATIELYRTAVEAEPQYALAHAKLAEAYTWKGVFVVPEEQEKWCSLAEEEIRQADLLDPELPETRVARVWLDFSAYGGYQVEAAVKEILQAQKIDPSIGHGELADLYIHLGLENLFKREFERSLEIAPTSLYTKREFMISYVLLNRWDDYLEIKQKYFPNDPVYPEYYLAKGDLEKAAPLIENRTDKLLYDLYKTDGKALLLALKGEKEASEAMIPEIARKLEKRRTDYHHITYEFAQIYAINGSVGEAVKWLRETAATGNPSYEMFTRDPFLDNIRQTPEFIAFMAEVKPMYEKYRSEFY